MSKSAMPKGKEQTGRAQENWETRNDSSKVASLLHREEMGRERGSQTEESSIEIEKNPKLLLVSDHRYQSDAFPIYRCKSCYCTETPIFPKHFKSLDDQMRYDVRTPEAKQMHKMHKQKGYVYNDFCEMYYPKRCSQKFFKFNEPSSPCKCCECCPVKYTIPRQVYEDYKAPTTFEEEYRQILESCNKEVQTDPRENPNSATPTTLPYKSQESEPKTRDQGTSAYAFENSQITFLNSNAETDICLSKLNTFRKENYFDCHCIDQTKNDDIPEHKCVHKYTINERLIPKPVNPDPFGLSCCCICNKVLNSDDSATTIKLMQLKEGTVAVEQKATKSAATNTNSRSNQKNEVTQTASRVSAKKNKIDIKIPLLSTNQDGKEMVRNVKLKPVVPTNSFALRHQKGVAKK